MNNLDIIEYCNKLLDNKNISKLANTSNNIYNNIKYYCDECNIFTQDIYYCHSCNKWKCIRNCNHLDKKCDDCYHKICDDCVFIDYGLECIVCKKNICKFYKKTQCYFCKRYVCQLHNDLIKDCKYCKRQVCNICQEQSVQCKICRKYFLTTNCNDTINRLCSYCKNSE